MHIADVIANNQALLELDITGNRLDYNTALAISKALRRNEELHVLKARACNVNSTYYVPSLALLSVQKNPPKILYKQALYSA